jgi:uncharacterized protein
MTARLRSLAWFLFAFLYYLFAIRVAERAASGFNSGIWFELFRRLFLLFLLIVGYAAMGRIGQKQRSPVKAMGLDPRTGWRHEFAIGSALGWGGVVACVLPVALIGGLIVSFYTNWHQFTLILWSLAALAISSLAEEVAFRGYPFQRLIDAIGPSMATFVISVLYGFTFFSLPGATGTAMLFTFFFGCFCTIAYLRTKALWVGWGFHFMWNVSMGVIFGLPISGGTSFSPVITSNTIGPDWFTGGDYGPEGSAIGVVVLLILMIVLLYATKDLKHRYAQPVIVPGGIPVDVDAIARQQHEAAMGPVVESSAPKLVQIAPLPSTSGPENQENNFPG